MLKYTGDAYLRQCFLSSAILTVQANDKLYSELGCQHSLVQALQSPI